LIHADLRALSWFVRLRRAGNSARFRDKIANSPSVRAPLSSCRDASRWAITTRRGDKSSAARRGATHNHTGTTNNESYSYDDAGNRQTVGGATWTTTANNRLTDDGTFTYTYDAFDRRIAKIQAVGVQALA
jgi:YD repeat-containing protein